MTRLCYKPFARWNAAFVSVRGDEGQTLTGYAITVAAVGVLRSSVITVPTVSAGI